MISYAHGKLYRVEKELTSENSAVKLARPFFGGDRVVIKNHNRDVSIRGLQDAWIAQELLQTRGDFRGRVQFFLEEGMDFFGSRILSYLEGQTVLEKTQEADLDKIAFARELSIPLLRLWSDLISDGDDEGAVLHRDVHPGNILTNPAFIDSDNLVPFHVLQRRGFYPSMYAFSIDPHALRTNRYHVSYDLVGISRTLSDLIVPVDFIEDVPVEGEESPVISGRYTARLHDFIHREMADSEHADWLMKWYKFAEKAEGPVEGRPRDFEECQQILAA